MSDENISLINYAINKNPVDFEFSLRELLGQKQEAALEARKLELAQSMYSPLESEEDLDDVGADEFEYDSDEDEYDDEELDYDEENFEEFDDIEDLDGQEFDDGVDEDE